MNQFEKMANVISRAAIASLFIWSGFSKLIAAEATQEAIASVGLPAPIAGYWLAILLELGGATALVFGFQTRWIAVALALFSLVTALAFHGNIGEQAQLVHFLKNVAISGGLIAVAASGGGGWSVDAMLATRRIPSNSDLAAA